MFDLGYNWQNYISLLKYLQDKGATLCRACDIHGELSVVLRHDIDGIQSWNIIKMALLEESMGIRSTYYIIVDPEYNYYEYYKDMFLELQDMGHEIGLHVNSVEESHRPWLGRNPKDAVKQLHRDIDKICSDGFNVRTMAAHGIQWHYTNKDLLRDVGIKDPIPFNTLFRDEDCILTDSMSIMTVNPIELKKGSYYILTHPENFDPYLNSKATEKVLMQNISSEILKTLT